MPGPATGLPVTVKDRVELVQATGPPLVVRDSAAPAAATGYPMQAAAAAVIR